RAPQSCDGGLMTHPTPSLSRPIEISKWWRNRAHEAIVVRLLSWKNRNLIDARVWHSAEGTLKPSAIASLARALAAAPVKAVELDLITADDDNDGGTR